MRLQYISLMSCTSLLITPSLRTLASFLNVLFPGGMQIVQPLFENSVLPFLVFDEIVGRPLLGGFSWRSCPSPSHLKEGSEGVRKISGKYSAPPPPVLFHDGGTVADY